MLSLLPGCKYILYMFRIQIGHEVKLLDSNVLFKHILSKNHYNCCGSLNYYTLVENYLTGGLYH